MSAQSLFGVTAYSTFFISSLALDHTEQIRIPFYFSTIFMYFSVTQVKKPNDFEYVVIFLKKNDRFGKSGIGYDSFTTKCYSL